MTLIISNINNNLVSYYKMDGSLGYLKDEKFKYDGSIFNVLQDSSGIINTGFYFDGSLSYAKTTDPSILSGKGDFSMSVWVKNPSDPSTINYFENSIISRGSFNFLRIQNEGYSEKGVAYGRIYDGSTSQIVIGTTDLRDDKWHHLGWVVDRDKGSYLYVDNILEDYDLTTNASLNLLTAPLLIGTRAGTYFTGNMDEFGMWNRALSQKEISQLYNNGLGKNYPFIENKMKLDGSSNLAIDGYPLFYEIIATSTVTNSVMSFSFWNTSDRMRVYLPNGTFSDGLTFTINLTTGQKIKFCPVKKDWRNVRKIHIGLSIYTIPSSVKDMYHKWINLEELYANTSLTYGGSVPENTTFNKCKSWGRTAIDMVVKNNTFDPSITVIENSKLTFDTSLFSTYSSLVIVNPAKWQGSFDQLPVKNWAFLTFIGDTSLMTGDIGTWINAQNSANKAIDRIGTGNYTSTEIINLYNLTPLQGGSLCGFTYLMVDVSTIYNRTSSASYGISSLRAIGKIKRFTNPNGVYSLGFSQSKVEGDLSEYNDVPIAYLDGLRLNIDNTRIINYSKTGSFRPKQLVWINCSSTKDYGTISFSEIDQSTLVNLLDDKTSYALANSQTGGYLYIAGSNPTITDASALYQIQLLSTPINASIGSGPYTGLNGLGWTVIANI